MLTRIILAGLLAMILALPAFALELVPDRPVYTVDQDIVVAAINDGARTVSFSSSAPFLARNLDTGAVRHFIGLAVMIELEPGERIDFQISRGELDPGPWSIEFRYREDGFEPCCKAIGITVVQAGGTPAVASSVGRLKAQHHSR